MESIPLHSDLIVSAKKNQQGVLLLEVAGEIDFEAAATLRTETFQLVHDHAPRRLVLNLKGVRYMGSAGLGVLVELRRKFTSDDGLVLTNLQPEVLNMVRIMKLASILTVLADDDAALAL